MEVSGQLHVPGALPQGKSRYPLDRRLSGPHSRSGRYGEAKNRLPLSGNEHRLLGRPVLTLVATLTVLPRLDERREGKSF
jgi:hypothetical protein